MMSARALTGARVAAVALAAVALAVPAASTAAPQQASAVNVTNFKLKAAWKEGWLTASVSFTVSVGQETSLNVSIRPVLPGPVTAHKIFALHSGSTPETIKLPARLMPREYVLRISGAPDQKFTIPSPVEGIVDGATVSTAQGGKSVRTVSNPHELWVRFHFLKAPATAKTVKIEWRTPSFTFVGAVTKPYATTIDSDLKSNQALPRGTWYAILMVDGKIAKRQDVRVN